MQNRAVDTWHGNILLQKVLLGMKLITNKNKRFNAVSNIIKVRLAQRLLREYFDQIKLSVSIQKKKNKKKIRADKFFKTNIS